MSHLVAAMSNAWPTIRQDDKLFVAMFSPGSGEKSAQLLNIQQNTPHWVSQRGALAGPRSRKQPSTNSSISTVLSPSRSSIKANPRLITQTRSPGLTAYGRHGSDKQRRFKSCGFAFDGKRQLDRIGCKARSLKRVQASDLQGARLRNCRQVVGIGTST